MSNSEKQNLKTSYYSARLYKKVTKIGMKMKGLLLHNNRINGSEHSLPLENILKQAPLSAQLSLSLSCHYVIYETL